MEHIGSYNIYWFIFSILIGIIFSYIALDLRWKMIEFNEILYKKWLLGCAVVMGIGIWIMHFVGMVAMEMQGDVVYDIRLVLLSMICSIIGTGIAFSIMKTNLVRLVIASLFMGVGIASMHYVGISALSVNYIIQYDPLFMMLSTLIAMTAAFGALWLLFFFNDRHSVKITYRIFSSILMGLGISGMHYSGMWGTHFYNDPLPEEYYEFYEVSSEVLSSFLSLPAIIVLFIMFVTSAFLDKKLIIHIKERRETERKLKESEKLSLVGELASGVAHEIRNPLTSLKGFTKIIYQKTRDNTNKEYLTIMMDEIDRINFIVNEFMVLSKPHLVKFSSSDLSHVLNSVVTLLKTQAVLKNIEILTAIVGNDFQTECEENQIKQVLVNVIKNSIEATPNGGKIYVKVESDNEIISFSINDEGVGISKDNMKQIGNPFFTTKAEGTGLGLMVSKKIVHNHNGSFDIESVENKGTNVTFTIPKINISRQEIMKNEVKDHIS
jgi:signal transduction histidine kinase